MSRADYQLACKYCGTATFHRDDTGMPYCRPCPDEQEVCSVKGCGNHTTLMRLGEYLCEDCWDAEDDAIEAHQQ